jgi:hypothetical protein
MMKYLMTVLLLLCVLANSNAQNKVTLSGYVKDKSTGERLIGSSVSVQELTGTGVTTNEYGYYSLTLPKGNYTIHYNYLGYVTSSEQVQLTGSQKLDMQLEQNTTTLQEVVVTSRKEDTNVKSMEMSTLKMQVAEIKNMPALLGEVDVIKAIQLMPGV